MSERSEQEQSSQAEEEQYSMKNPLQVMHKRSEQRPRTVLVCTDSKYKEAILGEWYISNFEYFSFFVIEAVAIASFPEHEVRIYVSLREPKANGVSSSNEENSSSEKRNKNEGTPKTS